MCVTHEDTLEKKGVLNLWTAIITPISAAATINNEFTIVLLLSIINIIGRGIFPPPVHLLLHDVLILHLILFCFP